MHTSLSPSHREGWLDFAIVACFLLIPHSFLLWMSSSEFGVSPLVRVPLFLGPLALLVIKLARPRPRHRSSLDPVVVFLWLAVLAQGVVMALIYTRYPGNVLSVYGQYFYWFALVGVFIGSAGRESSLYVFDLMRRYFLVVAAFAWLFAALYLVFGDQLPHSSVFYPDASGSGLLVADNYYFTLVYSKHSVFGWMVPRFTFLYKEPRILGMQLVMGLILQLAHVRGNWDRWPRSQRRRGLGALALVAGALFWTHSLNGYVFAICLTLVLGLSAIMGTGFWRRFRAVHMAAIGGGVGVLVAGFLVIGRRSDLSTLVEAAVAANYVGGPAAQGSTVYNVVGKNPEIVASYAESYLRGPRGLVRFPLGTGIMNLDSDRFMDEFGVPTTGGGTLFQFAAQNAGVIGLAMFAVIVWRLLERIGRLASATRRWDVRYVCLLGGFLLVVCTVYVDIISTSAYAPLVFGSLMNLRPEA